VRTVTKTAAVAPTSRHRMARRSQGIDYEESDVAQLDAPLILDRKTITVVSGPMSPWTLALWGLVLFLLGFLHGRDISNSARSLGAANTEIAAPTPIPSLSGAPAATPTQPTTAAPGHVVIKLLKYSPQTIEVRKGESVEWANDDLTPHTVTSQNGGELNSGSIDAGASWSHTFNQPGSFSYFCTFHPEMKGTVTVK
jgi:plastocyanin